MQNPPWSNTGEEAATFDVARLSRALGERYTLEERLGAGGMAVVYAAHDRQLNRRVALKVLRPDIGSAIGPHRFLREITVTAGMTHPNILPLYDSGEKEGILYYVMPLFEGRTLRDRLERDHQLPESEAIAIVSQVGAALVYAHARGILHRDIKPENILLDGGRAIVADFGVARALDADDRSLTGTGIAVGTPAYMSPEQSTAEKLDGRSDIYSLGAVLYEMLAGEPPFTGRTAQAIIAMRLSTSAPSIRVIRDGVSAHVGDALARALARSPADRFSRIEDFVTQLERPSGRVPRAKSRRSAMVSGAVVVLILVVISVWQRPVNPPGAGRKTDPVTQDLVLRAQRQVDRRSQASVQRGIELYRTAIARDSTSADAWAGYAMALQFAQSWRYPVPGIPKDSVTSAMVRASERAIEADSSNIESWFAKATVLRNVDPTSRAGMLKAIFRALSINPSSAQAWFLMGGVRMDMLQFPEAIKAYREAVKLDPAHENALAFLSLTYMWERKFDSALYWADSGMKIDRSQLFIRQSSADAHLNLSQLAEAEADYEAAEQIATGPDKVHAFVGLADVAERRGDHSGADSLLKRAATFADTLHPTAHDAAYLAWGYAATGRKKRAIAILQRFRPRGSLHFQLHLKRDPALDRLRSDPRFKALLIGPS